MNRITQIDPDKATGKAKELLDQVKSSLGLVPNLMRVLANSPAALQGYLGLNAALAGGALGAKDRERIALLTAEVNACGYCLSAHTTIGGMVGLNADDMHSARLGTSSDAKTAAILELARVTVSKRGEVSDEDMTRARRAGLSEAEVVETVVNVALNILTNYINHVASTVIDFPEAKPLKVAVGA